MAQTRPDGKIYDHHTKTWHEPGKGADAAPAQAPGWEPIGVAAARVRVQLAAKHQRFTELTTELDATEVALREVSSGFFSGMHLGPEDMEALQKVLAKRLDRLQQALFDLGQA